jgi:hypothetical protein
MATLVTKLTSTFMVAVVVFFNTVRLVIEVTNVSVVNIVNFVNTGKIRLKF